jgi:hypothetical protein
LIHVVGVFNGLLFNPEDAAYTFLRNVGLFSTEYTAMHEGNYNFSEVREERTLRAINLRCVFRKNTPTRQASFT